MRPKPGHVIQQILGLEKRESIVLGRLLRTIWVNQVPSCWQDPFSLSHPLLRRLQSDSSAQILGPLPNRPLAPEMHIVEAQMEQLQG